MSIKTTEVSTVSSFSKEFRALLNANPDIKQAIDNILHDTLVDICDASIELLDWQAAFEVTFQIENFEDEE